MAFTPGRTIMVVATSEPQSVGVESEALQALVTNLGQVVIFLRFGTGPQDVTTEDLPVLPMSQIVLEKGFGADTVAVVSESGTANVYFTVGSGG